MTDFSKQEPPDPNQPPPQGGSYPPPPQGGSHPPPPQAGSYPPPPQGGYGQQGGYPQAQAGYSPPGGYGQQGSYPGAPPVPPGYAYPPAGGPALPAGVELASRGRRVGAFFLAIPLSIVTLGIGYVIWGLIVWGKGTSPALQVLGMKCVDVNTGVRASWGKMALRDIVGAIATGILSFITGLVSFILFLTGQKRQTLADLIGSTVVVHDPNKVLA